jgi:hypothetical protein
MTADVVAADARRIALTSEGVIIRPCLAEIPRGEDPSILGLSAHPTQPVDQAVVHGDAGGARGLDEVCRSRAEMTAATNARWGWSYR